MSSPSRLSWFLSRSLANQLRHRSRCQSQGFTLIELLVASLITSVVLTVVFTGILAAINGNKLSEARTRRRIDLSRAFDFVSNEIRMASHINRTATTTLGGGTTLANVVTSSGLTLAELGNPTSIVLYLEIPISGPIPSSCTNGQIPATFDRVVYDIRDSTTGWLPPRSVHRYGRIPQIDGSIDPCSVPVSSDTLVDAIADQATTPTCTAPGQLTGSAGFHACVNGAEVEMNFQSDVTNLEIHRLSSKASSRVSNNIPIPVLTGNRQTGTDQMNLSWTWPGASVGVTYKLFQSVNNSQTEVYAGSTPRATVNLTGNIGTNHCYTVIATTGTSASLESNEICQVK
ncbi:MAG: type II secretion system protein J [Thermosynechococcaceae cyanobacterium]